MLKFAAPISRASNFPGKRRRDVIETSDTLVLVWGDPRDADTACEEILNRAREATVGVPSDTRQGLKDGTNGFERVLTPASVNSSRPWAKPMPSICEGISETSGRGIELWAHDAVYRGALRHNKGSDTEWRDRF